MKKIVLNTTIMTGTNIISSLNNPFFMERFIQLVDREGAALAFDPDDRRIAGILTPGVNIVIRSMEVDIVRNLIQACMKEYVPEIKFEIIPSRSRSEYLKRRAYDYALMLKTCYLKRKHVRARTGLAVCSYIVSLYKEVIEKYQ